MQVNEAVKKNCTRSGGMCKAGSCMAWLLVDENDDQEGICMYLGLTTALMKVLHLWGQIITAPKGNIVRG